MEAPKQSADGGLSTLRLQALSDGIFAIAMTLLVFEIKVPVGVTSDGELVRELLRVWPKFASCALSFVTLGYAWIGHHNQYGVIQRTDRVFLWINIAFLSAIAFVPFTSELLGEYPFVRTSVVLYAGNLAVTGALLYLHWHYATQSSRLGNNISPELIALTKRRVRIAPLSYLAVIGLSFLSTKISLIVCILVPIYFMVPGRVDRHLKAAAPVR